MNNTEELRSSLQQFYPQLSNSSLDRLLELYLNDPRQGCPYSIGGGILPSGLLEKESNAIYGCVSCGRRALVPGSALCR